MTSALALSGPGRHIGIPATLEDSIALLTSACGARSDSSDGVRCRWPAEIVDDEVTERAVLQVDGHVVVRRLGARSIARRVVFDPELRLRGDDPDIAVVRVVVTIEGHFVDAGRGVLDDLGRSRRRCGGSNISAAIACSAIRTDPS